MSDGNTYGKNRFREVRIKCNECGGSQTTNMQCDTGDYAWKCDLCNEETTHTVTEVEPMKGTK